MMEVMRRECVGLVEHEEGGIFVRTQKEPSYSMRSVPVDMVGLSKKPPKAYDLFFLDKATLG